MWALQPLSPSVSQASVSSLRSRFEQLATTTRLPTTAATPPEQQLAAHPHHPHHHHAAPPLRPSNTSSDPFSEPPGELQVGDEPSSGLAPPKADVDYRDNSLPWARQRPLSVYSTFSPPPPRSPPSFRVECPRSPPKPSTLDVPPDRPGNDLAVEASPAAAPSRPTSPIPKFRVGRTPPPPPLSPRHKRPKSTSFVADDANGGGIRGIAGDHLRRTPPSPTPPLLSTNHTLPPPTATGADLERARPGPPPIPTRTTKPKIPSRSPALSSRPETPSNALAPAVLAGEQRVSPFSTPPSSANNSPGRSDNESPHVRPPPRQPARKLAAPAPAFALPPIHPVSPVPAPAKGRSPVAPPPPPRMSMDQVRPRMKLGDSIKGQRMSLDDGASRPRLPPRPMGLIGGVKARVSRGRSHSPPRPPVVDMPNFLPPPKRGMGNILSKPLIRTASITTATTTTSATTTTTTTTTTTPTTALPDDAAGYGPDDSDDVSDDQSGLCDYPDSSQANRRRPYFKDGISEIPCKSDVRMFAVCGQYVCTISHSTKVWDIGTGRCIMAQQHSEGVRVTALAFKPCTDVRNEGAMLWLGTAHGELMEVDVASQRTVETRSSAHSKREVVKIHRCGFELWSLDDGGKLQVWGPDINGAPNLRNSPITFRINPRHSCSIVVDGYLWVGSGKSVDVFQPSTDPACTFSVSSRQLTASKPASDITCAAVVNSQPDRVYFGHSDGKVSIYSKSPLACIDVVSVSLYKINSMTGVGDYLWAGFKTGMVYVYDVGTKPWRALKDWQCSDGPVTEVVADLTSIWKNGRLQVVTLGADNVIRVWDGMLEEDRLEAEMQKNDVEFCSFREIKTLVCTWNAGASKPQDLLTRDSDKAFLEGVLNSVDSPDIIVFGFQELVDLEDKKITASSLPPTPRFVLFLIDLSQKVFSKRARRKNRPTSRNTCRTSTGYGNSN